VRETARLLKISAAKVSEGPADFGDRVSGFLIGHAKRTIKLSSKVIPASRRSMMVRRHFILHHLHRR
jgi:hypothetical protein